VVPSRHPLEALFAGSCRASRSGRPRRPRVLGRGQRPEGRGLSAATSRRARSRGHAGRARGQGGLREITAVHLLLLPMVSLLPARGSRTSSDSTPATSLVARSHSSQQRPELEAGQLGCPSARDRNPFEPPPRPPACRSRRSRIPAAHHVGMPPAVGDDFRDVRLGIEP